MGRTGTHSLKLALERLGYAPCYHMHELLKEPCFVKYWQEAQKTSSTNWQRVFRHYQATVDYPGNMHYQTLMRSYPNAKVILSVRDADAWYESTKATLYAAKPSVRQVFRLVAQLPFSARTRNLVRVYRLGAQYWRLVFQGKFKNKIYALQVFEQHNAEVIKAVAEHRLLVFDVKEGWAPLCNFLGQPIPNEAFPHSNDRKSFKTFQKTFN